MDDYQYYIQNLLDELHIKLMLTDVKSKIGQTIYSLIDDQVYTKEDVVYALIEVMVMIEKDERKMNF